MTIYISLLRGINVGGNKKIKMADLRNLYETLGFTDVKSLLQSGNVVFKSDETDQAELAAKIEGAIEQTFGFHSQIFILTVDNLKAIVSGHPFSEQQLEEPKKIMVFFLERIPRESEIASLREAHTGPEEMTFKGQVMYAFYPNGMGRSKLDNALIDRKLKISATARNWNTTNKLLAETM